MFGPLREWMEYGLAALAVLPTAALARLMVHMEAAARGERNLLDWRLAMMEATVAIVAAIIGGGLAEYYGVTGMPQHAIVGAVAWLGPRGAETVLAALLKRK